MIIQQKTESIENPSDSIGFKLLQFFANSHSILNMQIIVPINKGNQ